MNVVDRANSVWEPSGAANPLAFHLHRLPEVPLFRVPVNNATQVFCTENLGEFDFKSAIEESGLTGLTFREAWNSEVGGIPRVWNW